jgi:sugar phosphate isomerase/epimerase
MPRLPLSCNTVLFGMTSLEDALQHLAWAGYDGAELSAVAAMADHVKVDGGKEWAQRVRGLAADLGLTLCSIEVTPNEPARVEAVVRTAAELEIPVVAIGSGGKTGDEESFRQSVALGRQLAEIAGRYGVKLAMKPHVGAAVYNTETALRALKEIDSPHLGLNFDPSHLHRAGEDVAEAARVFGRANAIAHSHFRDCPWSDGQRPGAPEQQVPGRGEVDIPGVVRALLEVGYAGPLSLECIGAKQYPLSRAAMIAAENRGYMNRVMQEIGA